MDLFVNFGVGDRNRTCIKRICNPWPNRSAAHPHCLAPRVRLERTTSKLTVWRFYRLSYRGIEIGAEYQNRTDNNRLEICSFTIKLIPL